MVGSLDNEKLLGLYQVRGVLTVGGQLVRTPCRPAVK